MDDTLTCGACGAEIVSCEECGGNNCTPGCEDRVTFEDACECEKDEDDGIVHAEEPEEGMQI
ncbi:MAG: hypothetical protein JWM56_714 [Candidatus Peribacteria bacterium]|nr:hypothetical protein [Candidatus Peribacteria bacterium]